MDLLHGEHMPQVKAVMTPFPHFVEPDDPITRAEEIMREHGVRHVPVQEAGELVGVVSDRDIGLLVNRALEREGRAKIKVQHVCVRDHLFVVDLFEPLDAVLSVMAERHIGSALVVRKRKLVGIFTVTDACRVLAKLLRARHGRGPDEAA